MKIKIKHNLIIFKKENEWNYIREKIKQDFGANIFMISWRLKRELGFTVRYHQELNPLDDDSRFYYANEIHLDFYNESALSYFMLKYINIDN
jgi:hypothetical protein